MALCCLSISFIDYVLFTKISISLHIACTTIKGRDDGEISISTMPGSVSTNPPTMFTNVDTSVNSCRFEEASTWSSTLANRKNCQVWLVLFKCNMELRCEIYNECIQKQGHLCAARLKHHQRSEWYFYICWAFYFIITILLVNLKAIEWIKFMRLENDCIAYLYAWFQLFHLNLLLHIVIYPWLETNVIHWFLLSPLCLFVSFYGHVGVGLAWFQALKIFISWVCSVCGLEIFITLDEINQNSLKINLITEFGTEPNLSLVCFGCFTSYFHPDVSHFSCFFLLLLGVGWICRKLQADSF